MKKTFAVALSVLVIGGMIAGCSSNSSSGSASGASKGSSSASSGKEIDMIISTLNNPFFVSLKNGAEAEAKKLGINLVIQNANNDNQTELNLAQTDILKKPAALVLDPVDSNAIVASINQANQAKIPVYAFDRLPTGGKLETFIGYDAINAGKTAADALAKALNEKGNVIEIQGIMGTNVAQDRSKGFEQEIAKYPNIKVVAKQPADFDRAKALNVMTNLIQAHSDVNGVYAANDEMAMGVVSALKARGMTQKVTVVGNDGIKDALDSITNGTMKATNAESPFYEGMQVADIAKDILDGKQVKSSTTLEGQLVTKANVDNYWKHLKEIGDPQD
ncbi:substrate-binding domain-containing protein [Heyndrickxia acidicola]|uniref:Substrate-binding domain-containing protein n=1 Tax=Heyndrickxia acidicola TaxID=209389 RepID=A0ABU6MIC0_9BACI|nr:substrate-binding domain-containing protein [Heyndrickxia acidicola]MED1204189.1 substrate-binding domain-containing protein [Heyndrickxia acidicola]